MRKFALFLIILFSTFFFSKTGFLAEFAIEYDVEYRIDQLGNARVKQKTAITNLDSGVYPSNYSMILKNTAVSNLEGSDRKGPLEFEVEELEQNTIKISTEFNEQIVGAGKVTEFTINYDSSNISSKVGNIYTITIPKIEIIDQTKNYNLKLIIPNSLGPKIYVSPAPTSEEVTQDSVIYFFDKESLKKGGISSAFGNYQQMNFNLKYILKNENFFGNYIEIALPTDIYDKQQVIFSEISETPALVYQDKDRNLLAKFFVNGNSTKNIVVSGTVKIKGRQIVPQFGGLMSEIPKELRDLYTKEQPYWETNEPSIKSIAKDLYNPNQTVSQNANRVYDFVVKNLKYEFELINQSTIVRKGAAAALDKSTQNACMEFTDLFIAVTRAMGIPAREINGFAYTEDSNDYPLSINLRGGDVLHAWPEFYDPAFGWVFVDPTWGNTSGLDFFTKMDTNHFAFVTKGVDSQYPYPAGSYRTDPDQKLVNVEISAELSSNHFGENPIRYYEIPLLNLVASLFNKQALIAENNANFIIYNLKLGNESLLPFSAKTLIIDKEISTINYKSFYGTDEISKIEILKGKPVYKSFISDFYILSAIVLEAILLCSFLYLLIIRAKNRKKQSHPPDLPHEGQDQQQNRNSK